ncbi:MULTISPECIES: fumarylacetoacetate hydrolase family protein [unclassified Haloparvum]|uniref:fumarylacetoacetate hydrolase family protein n=1 Tax=Haloparvum sp. PAK95 TaxID=3418962 RepID=UPI003D2F0DE7
MSLKYFRVGPDGDRLAVSDGDGAYDLTAANSNLTSFTDLADAAAITGGDPDDIAESYLGEAEPVEASRLTENAALPVVPEEVWGAGVTYSISEAAREEESTMPEMYMDVYDAERPEIFFKATPSRLVAPGEPVGIRGDSDWNVPEPELGLVLRHGEIVGVTAGNDMSSRAIEGENPLYLPQAKVYQRCCTLGPCVVSWDEIDPADLEIRMEIERDGETVFDDTTNTGEMKRSCEELVDYYVKHNTVPKWSVLLTGTSLVPPDSFTLQADDDIRIHVDDVGTLGNPVTTV